MKNGSFTKIKRLLVGISGILLAICSVILSKRGVGITGDLAWMGTVIALSLFCAELMFNSSFDELNWTMLVLGLGAYIYSIWTNVEGFYYYRGISGNLWSNFDTTNFFGGMFMDIYPELAIAWALGESKIGDLIGNTVKTFMDPEKLTEPISQKTQKANPQTSQQASQPREEVPPYLQARQNQMYESIKKSNSQHANGNNKKG